MGKNGGKRPGAGRKKGIKTQAVLDREESLRQFRLRIQQASGSLQNSQIGLGRGSQYLFKVITFKGQKSDPILVKDQKEMEAYLRGDFDKDYEDDDKKKQTTYYFLTAKDPDNKALDSMFNRLYGKVADSMEITNPDGNLKVIMIHKAK